MSENIFHIPVMDIMITSKCNMRCKYCFEAKKIQKSLDFEEVLPYFDARGAIKFFMFGGEPLMNADFIEKMFDYYNNTDMGRVFREEALYGCRSIITNGLLIDKYIDLINKHKLRLQISLDGPKHVHDLNRVTVGGNGTFDKLMKNVKEVCVPNKMDFKFHGVITRDTIGMLSEISKFYFDMQLKFFGKKYAIDRQKMNLGLIIFEEDYDDDDIDNILDQLVIYCEYLWNHPQLDYQEKRRALYNYLTNKGGICGAGTGLMAVDHTLSIFPCHRQADNAILDKDTVRLGTIYENDKLGNFEVFNSFFRIGRGRKMTYSYNLINNGYKNPHYWLDWCPSTNQHTSGVDNPYHISSKYVVMHLEIHRLVGMLLTHYNIPKGGFPSSNSKQSNKRTRN